MATGILQQTSYTVTLSDRERDDLLALLRRAFEEARVEVHRTHTPGFREFVIGQEDVLRELIVKLERIRPCPAETSTEFAGGIETEAPLVDALFMDAEGRFQMAAADLDEFIGFLRDHEIRAEAETSGTFRSAGEIYGYGRLAHLYDADSASDLYRTWRQARTSRSASATS